MKKSYQTSTLLVSAPFLWHRTPPPGVATLKSVLNAEGFTVDTLYLPLHLAEFMGEASYNHFAFNPRASEMLYACCMFPEIEKSNKTYSAYLENIQPRYANPYILPDEDYDLVRVLKVVKQFNRVVKTTFFKKRYDIVGFSLVTNQLLASLFFSKMYKKLYPDSITVFGGPICAGEAGESYLRAFPWIDYVVDGEGEITLVEIAKQIERKGTEPIAGCSFRSGKNIITAPARPYNKNLNQLPVPDYNDFFDVANKLRQSAAINFVPVEMSRGCWWNKCTFCDCPYFHKSYRVFSPKKILSNMEELSRRHRILNFFGTDLACCQNPALPRALAKSKKEFRFFLEFRPSILPNELRQMKDAGLFKCFLGVESLSTSLLKKMKKGITTIQNIQALKHAALVGIETDCNLIYDYPGETKAEFRQTTDNIKRCWHLLSKFYETRFALARGSLAFKNPGALKITSIRRHILFSQLFPRRILDKLEYLMFDFTTSYSLHGPYRDELSAQGWVGNTAPGLSYLDGGDFLLIYDTRGIDRTGAYDHRRMTISNPARKLLLYCDRIRSFDDIRARFAKLSKKSIADALGELCAHNIMFHESGSYISLVMPDKRSMHTFQI